ncbi:uncharacterized protein F4807DRAFT_86818 [Annulohypoxylon truncatum]|uniref:uncharacterized protein n=1 Tax=Annulohypoxylon truncatum TaxID=327061 RepID=UPI002007BEF2|nr:uncharacterized protein F4807DRAFT_86818 [Annulohypoxylon truncatum]KAI1209690.1 hypothetical protein F4807DRAFT_86818 [Annulohypoxylon truncatum]
MSSLLQRKFPSILHSHIPPAHRTPLLLAAGAAALSAPLLAYAYKCYTAWLALGRGGVPYNVFGWLAQSSLHILARTDLRSPVPGRYASAEDLGKVYGPAGARSYFGEEGEEGGRTEIPPRKPPRPTVPSFVAPQRQVSEVGSPSTVEALNRFAAALADANPELFELKASQLEGPLYKALWVRQPPVPSPQDQEGEKKGEEEQGKTVISATELQTRVGRGTTGEWAHVHGEGSTHVTLSPVDAATLISKGWAERHGMSGVGGAAWAMAPWGYVLIYAPRDEDEFEVWKEVLLAGARYISHGLGKKVVAPEEEDDEDDDEEEEDDDDEEEEEEEEEEEGEEEEE